MERVGQLKLNVSLTCTKLDGLRARERERRGGGEGRERERAYQTIFLPVWLLKKTIHCPMVVESASEVQACVCKRASIYMRQVNMFVSECAISGLFYCTLQCSKQPV